MGERASAIQCSNRAFGEIVALKRRRGEGAEAHATFVLVPSHNQPSVARTCTALSSMHQLEGDPVNINRALIATVLRAETRPERLSESFVQVDVLETLLQTPDHQVLFGRRGTGKTHILRVLKHILDKSGDLAILIDMRTVASTGGILADSDRPFTERATLLLKDTIGAIETALAEYLLTIAYANTKDFTACMRALDMLADELTTVHIRAGAVESSVTTARESGTVGEHSLSIALGTSPVSISSKDATSNKDTIGSSVKRTGSIEHHVSFSTIQQALSKVIELIPAKRVYILLDEWTDLPNDLQPVLAEFLRRCLLPVSGLSVKIGAIEERAHFATRGGQVGDYVGFELGSDVAGNADLDDFFCAQHDADLDRAFLEDLIFNHVRALDPTLVRANTALSLVSEIFDDAAAFTLLVDSAAGVPRDALNILKIAALRAGTRQISTKLITEAIRTWYTRDKLGAIRGDHQTLEVFSDVVRKVIGQKRQICFLVRDPEIGNPHLGKLFDARLVHVVRKDIPSPSDVFLRYTLFRIDTGAYVDLPSDQLPKMATKYMRHAEYPVIFFPS